MKVTYIFINSVLTALIFFSDPAFADPAYITGTQVNIRKAPDIKAPVVKVVPFLQPVTIIEEGPFVEVSGIGRNLWYRIETGGRTGWVFGSFVTKNYCLNSSGQVLVYAQAYDVYGATSLFRIGFMRDEGPLKYQIEASSVSLSPSCTYLATDSGSDIIGLIAFYKAAKPDSRPIFQATHDRGELVWEGECLTFHDIQYIGNGCTLWKEKQFCNGSVAETGRTGRSIFHETASTPDRRCNQ